MITRVTLRNGLLGLGLGNPDQGRIQGGGANRRVPPKLGKH